MGYNGARKVFEYQDRITNKKILLVQTGTLMSIWGVPYLIITSGICHSQGAKELQWSPKKQWSQKLTKTTPRGQANNISKMRWQPLMQ